MYNFKCQKIKNLDNISILIAANIILVFDHGVEGPSS